MRFDSGVPDRSVDVSGGIGSVHYLLSNSAM
jgi:hypothetical protein